MGDSPIYNLDVLMIWNRVTLQVSNHKKKEGPTE